MKSFIVDSFTKERFKGNPAAVCLLEKELNDEKMQSIAAEFNLSETAFIKEMNDGEFSIRFFSPLQEIDLCGHATLAAAKVLFDLNTYEEVLFSTINELKLRCRKKAKEIEMEFPLFTTTKSKVSAEMLLALGIDKAKNCEYNKENNVLLIEIEEAKELAELEPDFESLKKSHESINGVAITAASNDEFDFHSRYFWPWTGGNEDPVTGAIHTFLASYWQKRLKKRSMCAFQASKRGGFLNLEIVDDQNLIIRSEAQIVLKGNMQL